MKLQAVHYLRNSLLSKETIEQRRDAVAYVKAAKIATNAIGLISVGFAILDAHEGRVFRALSFLPLAYTSYELGALAENSREILENPVKELRAVCSKIHSDEEFWRFFTTGAPLARKIGLSYLSYKGDPADVSRASQLWSKITSWK